MDRSWLIHESPGLKPDWLGDMAIEMRLMIFTN